MKMRSVETSMEQMAELMLPLIEQGIAAELTATGNSMRPLWRHRRDIIKLSAVDSENIKKWDVLLYRRPNGSYVLHRVVGLDSETLDFLGDAQFGVERGVPKARVVARAIGYKRGGGKYRSVDSLGYKAYVLLWCHSRTIRYFFYRIFVRIKRMFGADK